jgi:hypothetical protein
VIVLEFAPNEKDRPPFHRLLFGNRDFLGLSKSFLPDCWLARGSDQGTFNPVLYLDGPATVVCCFSGWKK